MVAIVRRAAIQLEKKPRDLLPVWEREVAKAVKMNYGVYDTRSFLLASSAFLTKVGAEISPDVLKIEKERRVLR